MKRFIRFSLPVALLLALSVLLWPSQAQAQCTVVNGTFEDTTLNGWTVSFRTLAGYTSNWYNYTGTVTPLSSHTISAPPQGSRAAVSDQTNASTQVMYQDVAIPAGASATLSFYIYYNNTYSSFVTPNSLDYAVNGNANQQFRVDVITTTANIESVAAGDVLLPLYQTKVGDPLVKSPTLVFYDLSSLAGQTVRIRFAEAVGLNFFVIGIDSVCLTTTRGTITRPTPTGSNVQNNFGDLALNFPTVATAGTTSLLQLDAAAQTAPPTGDTFLSPAFDISTTAVFTPPVNVCFTLPAITNATTFQHLRVLHKPAGVWVDEPTSVASFSSKQLCAKVTSLSPFAVGQSSGSPTSAAATISGTITTSDGAPLAGASVNLVGANSRKTITDSSGNYRFENVEAADFYSVTASRSNYRFSPSSRSFSVLGNVTDASFSATRDTGAGGNDIDSSDYFVRQHYLDFLGREPDESGFNFWSDQILSCGGDVACVDRRRTNVSAAYFLSIEFQQTGGLVDGLYRASFDRRPMYAEFMPDAAVVSRDVVVGPGNWAQQLEANKQAFIDAWVARPDFHAAYDNLGNDAFVDTLISHTEGGFNGDRAALVNGLSNGTMSRAAVLRQVVENEGFVRAKSNQMFVMMEYFGYLRRDPDESGYHFWLNKLNQFGGNFEQAEMVKSFIVSGEYRDRFR